MSTLTINLPEAIKSLAETRAAESGHSLEDYVASLISADIGERISAGFEADLLHGLDSPASDWSAREWSKKIERFESRSARGQ